MHEYAIVGDMAELVDAGVCLNLDASGFNKPWNIFIRAGSNPAIPTERSTTKRL